MLKWEFKKIYKDRSFLAILAILIFNVVAMTFLNPQINYEEEKKSHYMNVKSLSGISILKDNDYLDKYTKDLSQMAYDKLQKDSGEEYKDIEFYKMFYFRISNALVNISMCIVILIIFSRIYVEERESKVDNILLSSKKRYNALYSKLGLSLIISTFIYVTYIVVIGIITAMQYGFSNMGYLQAYRIVDNSLLLKGSFTINQYLALTVVTILGLYIILALFTSMCSFLSKNSVSSIAGATVVLILFKVLSELKFLPEGILNILKNINFIDVFRSPQMFIGTYKGSIILLSNNLDIFNLCYLILFLLIILGIMINIYIFKKVL
ncbi:hypothetical protein QYB59_001639 [Clostridium perfringens]|nr:hypothetical protein [Clostridium perfringens]